MHFTTRGSSTRWFPFPVSAFTTIPSPFLSDHSLIAAAVLCEYIQPHDILYISLGRMHELGPQSLPHSIPRAAVKCEKASRCLGS